MCIPNVQGTTTLRRGKYITDDTGRMRVADRWLKLFDYTLYLLRCGKKSPWTHPTSAWDPGTMYLSRSETHSSFPVYWSILELEPEIFENARLWISGWRAREWLLRCAFVLNFREQCKQIKGLICSWTMRVCLCKPSLKENARPHRSHLNGLIFSWTRRIWVAIEFKYIVS